MAPPKPPRPQTAGTADAAPAVPFSARASVLRRRADFLAAARAISKPCPGFILQARERRAEEVSDTPIRLGYTCSKKVGNAVARNRAKRRLREAARAVFAAEGQAGWDYVLIGRKDRTANLPMPQLVRDLRGAVARVHGGGS